MTDAWRAEIAAKAAAADDGRCCENPNGCLSAVKAKGRCGTCLEYRRTPRRRRAAGQQAQPSEESQGQLGRFSRSFPETLIGVGANVPPNPNGAHWASFFAVHEEAACPNLP